MKTVEEFINYYAEEFNLGDINKDNYNECLHYLLGFMDSFFYNKEHNLDYARMARCVEALRGAGNLVEILRREAK